MIRNLKTRSRRRLIGVLVLAVSTASLLLLHYYPRNLATQLLHASSHLLADGCSRDGQTKLARLFQTVSTRVFPMSSWCGNAQATDIVDHALIESRILEQSGDLDGAIRVLIPEVLETGFTDKTAIVDRLLRLLRRTYSEAEIWQLLQDSLASIRHAEGRADFVYSIDLLGVELEFVHFGPAGTSPRDKLLLWMSGQLGAEASDASSL